MLTPVDGAVRTWFVVALVLSLIGDAFLLDGDRWFLPGLASFLLAHATYIVGLALVDDWRPVELLGGVVGALAFVTSDSLLGWRMFVIERAAGAAPTPWWMPPAIMATYHVAQLLLVLALLG